jgi:hypothetical protein
MDLETKMRTELIKFLVQKHIFCPFSEAFGLPSRVLDVRTCVVILDPDGDPKSVMSPEAWEHIQTYPGPHLAAGHTIMER